MSIKSISRALTITVCAGLLSVNTHAAAIKDSNSGLLSPDIVIDFGNNLYAAGTTIDNQFLSSGVTFGPTFLYNDINTSYVPLTQGYLENINISSQPGSILFSLDVTAADFSWRTLKNTTTTFSAFNNNVLVEEFTDDTNTSETSGRFFGFKDILFDEIRFSIGHTQRGFTLDNLEYVSAIPVPAAVWLFGSGLLALIGFARRKR